MPESTAVLLRRAATRLDELARHLPSPWMADGPEVVDPPGVVPSEMTAIFLGLVSTGGDERGNGRRAVLVEKWDAPTDDGMFGRISHWAAALGPQVAAPLAAWLRETAEYVAAVQCSPPAGAVALARALLGETAEDGKGRTLRRPMTSPQGPVARHERLSGFTGSALPGESTESSATVADSAGALLGETERAE